MQKQPSSYSSVSPRAGPQPRILVVDDEAAVRRYVRRVLEAEGYAVGEAGDGIEALEFVRSTVEGWDLLVSDIVMPRCNGIELQQTLSGLASALPVILMSGYATSQLTEIGIAAPCGVLVKPFKAEELLDEVRRCLPVGP